MYLPKLEMQNIETVDSFFYPLFWGIKNSDVFLQHIRAACDQVKISVHCADNFVTWGRNNSMLADAAFVQSWQSNAESNADEAIVWRRYILACASYHCVHLEGDFVECGGYTGVGVKTVLDYVGGKEFPKPFWVYDLFVHEPGMLHEVMPEHGPTLYERVKLKFKDYPQVHVIKGAIPEVFLEQSPEKIAYLHVDLNQAPAEIAALDALFDRVVPGASSYSTITNGPGCTATRNWPKTLGSKLVSTGSSRFLPVRESSSSAERFAAVDLRAARRPSAALPQVRNPCYSLSDARRRTMAAYWIWWIAAAALIAAELLTGTFYLLVVGLAVACAGVAALLGGTVLVEWLIACVLGVLGTIWLQRWKRTFAARTPEQRPLDVGAQVRVMSWGPDRTARVAYRAARGTPNSRRRIRRRPRRCTSLRCAGPC